MSDTEETRKPGARKQKNVQENSRPSTSTVNSKSKKSKEEPKEPKEPKKPQEHKEPKLYDIVRGMVNIFGQAIKLNRQVFYLGHL